MYLREDVSIVTIKEKIQAKETIEQKYFTTHISDVNLSHKPLQAENYTTNWVLLPVNKHKTRRTQ